MFGHLTLIQLLIDVQMWLVSPFQICDKKKREVEEETIDKRPHSSIGKQQKATKFEASEFRLILNMSHENIINFILWLISSSQSRDRIASRTV